MEYIIRKFGPEHTLSKIFCVGTFVVIIILLIIFTYWLPNNNMNAYMILYVLAWIFIIIYAILINYRSFYYHKLIYK